jgi:hypothetical protein
LRNGVPSAKGASNVMEERGLRQFDYDTPAYPRFLRNFER